MKTIKLLVALLMVAATIPMQAQTADEIISNYLENTGGEEAWKALKGVKMDGVVRFGGMEIPMEMVQLTEGKMMSKADFQGMTFYQGVFDGETLWSTNQMTMAAEKSDAETTANTKLDMNDFPDQFLNYKEKGYTVELLGKETVEGTETFKIKVTKEPKVVDGKEVPSVSFVYFDDENFVPIVQEEEVMSGPAKGMTSSTKFSDYTEVDGLYFPFSINAGVKGQPQGQEVVIKNVELNPEIDSAAFAFPEKQ